MGERPTLSPNQIGLFIGFEECPRYLVQTLNDVEEKREELGVFLSEAGDKFERETLDKLRDDAAVFADWEDWELDEDFEDEQVLLRGRFAEVISEAEDSGPAVVYQAPLRGSVGTWDVRGKSDLICLWVDEDSVVARVLEIKASREIRPYHQIQATVYSLMLQDILEDIPKNIEVQTGIIHRERRDVSLDPGELPRIDDAEVVEDDVRNLLRADGIIDKVYKESDKGDTISTESYHYRLSGKCNYCLFNQNCFSHAVRNRGLALLGLTEGEQQVLKEHGITKVEELAALKNAPEDPRPYVYENLEVVEEEAVKSLLNEPIVGDKLDDLVQQAQSMLEKLNPSMDDREIEGMVPLQGSGQGALPATNPSPRTREHMDYDPDGLIRVYMYVREDFMRDSIALVGARIVREASDSSPRSVSVLSDSLPSEKGPRLDVEGALLREFFEKLFGAIRDVAEYDEEVLHLYFFSRLERDQLIEGVMRDASRWDEESFGAVRDLLGFRQAIDQPMVSIIQEEVQRRYANRYPSSGLLPLLWQAENKFCNCGCGGGRFGKYMWQVERSDGTEVDLWDAFHYDFFNYLYPVKEKEDGFIVPAKGSGEPYYPLRARFDNQLPLEYIWAENGKLDDDWAKNEQQVEEIDKFRYHKGGQQRVSKEDIRLVAEKLSHALQHVEQSLGHAHNAFELGKEPVNIPEVSSITLGESNLARASREYIDLEHFSNRQEKLQHYAKSPRERLRTGKSAIIEVKDVRTEDDDLIVEGKLVYDDREFDAVDRVANACRFKDSSGATTGERLVANEVEWDAEYGVHEDRDGTPSTIERGVPVEVASIDVANREITLNLSNLHQQGNYFINFWDEADIDYVQKHDTWTVDPSEAGSHYGRRAVLFRPGDRYILDRSTDNWPAMYGINVMDNIEEVDLYNEINGLLGG